MTNPDLTQLVQQFNARRLEIDRREASAIDLAVQWANAERARLQAELFQIIARQSAEAAAVPTAEPVDPAKPCGCPDAAKGP